jgi:GNAT superfamily N-acetyltransferase
VALLTPPTSDDRQIFLDPGARFVPTTLLDDAYVRYEETQNPSASNHVRLDDGLELGIVSSAVPEIARGISSMLSRSLDDARNDHGGHLPIAVVQRVQSEIISPYGVANLWGTTGHRFVLSRRIDGRTSELLATILVGRRKGTIFFLTGRYNNLRHSQIADEVDFDQPAGTDPGQRWFDQFVFPDLERFKPTAYHQIANFVVAKEHRGEGLAERLLAAIVGKYAKDDIDARGAPIEHSQHLLCGRGLWQIGDPPWLARMEKLGFYLRWGAESFFIEHDWAPLPPTFDRGRPLSNREYNRSFGLPHRYQEGRSPPASSEHLLDRVDTVVSLSQDPRAKLQYFQTMFDFT